MGNKKGSAREGLTVTIDPVYVARDPCIDPWEAGLGALVAERYHTDLYIASSGLIEPQQRSARITL